MDSCKLWGARLLDCRSFDGILSEFLKWKCGLTESLSEKMGHVNHKTHGHFPLSQRTQLMRKKSALSSVAKVSKKYKIIINGSKKTH